MAKFDYKKAEADLYDAGARHPDEIYEGERLEPRQVLQVGQ